MSLQAVIQWHPHLGGFWCSLLVAGAGAWLWLLYARLRRRMPAGWTAGLLAPKCAAVLLLLVLLFDPVSAIHKSEPVKGKLLALVDASSSMDVADDYHVSRAARARQIVERWKQALPGQLAVDELEFDTTIHAPGAGPRSGVHETDLAGCLMALAERAEAGSYMGIALLTDGGDEPVESAVLPKAALHVVGIGTDPAGWNDLAIADVQCPPTAEKDIDFEITVDVRAHTGHGQGFAQRVERARLVLEHATGPDAWEKVLEQPVELTELRGRAKLPAKCAQTGPQRFRVSVAPVAGELSSLNNARVVAVDVRRKALRVLYFTRDLGQEFKLLRNELGRDPGISFAALLRTTSDRYTLQGDRLLNDQALAGGFPTTREGLEPFDVVIIGSFPADDCTPRQMEALTQYVENGGALVFLGGDQSFGRGGYARTSLAPLFPWRISDREPEPEHSAVSVRVPPMGLGHPILATVEDLLGRNPATLDSVNLVDELKPGATALLEARLGARAIPVIAVQPFGKGKVLAIASNTLWKWATQPEPLRPAYGLFWRQAVRNLAGKTEGGQNLAVRFDKDSYRPGEEATVEIRPTTGITEPLRFSASLSGKDQSVPLAVEPVPGQARTFQTKLRFRQRGDYLFRLVAYRSERVLETFEKALPILPGLPEGARLELDESFLKHLAERGGGNYFREADAGQLIERLAGKHSRKVTIQESSLVEAGPWFALLFLAVLVAEWILRRKRSLF